MNTPKDGIRVINYNKILESPNYGALVKQTIKTLQTQQYLTLTEFLINISNSDLKYLINLIEKVSFDEDAIDTLIILSEVINSGEGEVAQTDEVSGNCFYYFINALICESLSRKGIIEMDYSKISFDKHNESFDFAKIKDDFNPNNY